MSSTPVTATNSTASAEEPQAINGLTEMPLVMMGPSGVGKGTLNAKLRERFQGCFSTSVSHTTRKCRQGEVDGVHYHFVSREAFLAEVELGRFVEYAEVHGNLYGTSVASIQDVARQGKICILEIDIQGATTISVRDDIKCHYVFVRPPTFETLQLRLQHRNSETQDSINLRLATAKTELKLAETCSFPVEHIVNDDLVESFEALVQILVKMYPHLSESDSYQKVESRRASLCEEAAAAEVAAANSASAE